MYLLLNPYRDFTIEVPEQPQVRVVLSICITVFIKLKLCYCYYSGGHGRRRSSAFLIPLFNPSSRVNPTSLLPNTANIGPAISR
ncbi:hypothetical protein BDQ12DRAFT_73643 [Crucibulum laeve]|uniref:Uncharacterized protein n=1 Tax=Crucibulum laeve TaxID=68775 RepID=A0A5C3M317_9AGAR|nr:hypothetical protein BDQ12DRAFT_73643 [Crucibulum laeve]